MTKGNFDVVNTNNTKDQTSERAKELYENVIKHELTDDQLGMYIAIDVGSGDYEIGADRSETIRTLRHRRPDGQLFGMLHGSYSVGYIGYAPPRPGSWSLVE